MRLLLLILGTTAAVAAETTPEIPQADCKPGGFAVIRFSNGVEARGKADAMHSVHFDAAAYQGNAFDSALRSAMASWSAVSGSRWRYSFSGYDSTPASSEDGRMTVARGGLTFPPGVLASTLTAAMASTGEIIDADIFFNPDAELTTGGSGVDFESVALHEMGHGLGLGHNDGCSIGRTVMESTLSAGMVVRSLFPAEMEGVRYLYPAGSGGGPGPAPVLAVAPASLAFTAILGGAVPAAQTLSLAGPNGASWLAGASVNWLRVNPGSGTLPTSVQVSVVPAGLTAGTHVGRLTITSGAAARDVLVTLNVLAPPVLQASPATLAFSVVAGSPAPTPKNVSLSGTAGQSWSATSSASWLQILPGTGSLPALLTVFVNPAGLPPQTYTAKISVLSAGLLREIAVQLEVTTQPRLQVEPTELSLSASAGSNVPVCASFRAQAGTIGPDFTAATQTSWLTVLPRSGRLPASLSVCASAAHLDAGTYTGSVSLAAAALGSPLAVRVNLSVAPVVLVSDGGVVSAAAYRPGQPVAAGELLTVFGVNLCSRTLLAGGFPLPADLGDCRVLIGGVPAPLIYASPAQINLVVPAALANLAGTSTVLTVFNGRLVSPSVRLNVARQTPGIFTVLGAGAGAGAITHADGSLVSRLSPLAPGETILIYLTGLGPLSPPVPDGAPAPADPLAAAASAVRVLVDGEEATVLFAGASPGFAGLQVVSAAMPSSLARRFPELVVEVEGTPSNRVSAGGPSLLDVTPFSARAGSEATLTLRGVNLPPSPGVSIGGESLPAVRIPGDGETVRVTVPARLLTTPGPLSLRAFDVDAPDEHPSNPVVLTVTP